MPTKKKNKTTKKKVTKKAAVRKQTGRLKAKKTAKTTAKKKAAPAKKRRGMKIAGGDRKLSCKITQGMIAAWQYRRLGWPIETTSQMLGISTATVKRYDKTVQDEFAEMPAVRASIDALKIMVPKAVRVYSKVMEKMGTEQDRRTALAGAKDILNNFKIITEKLEDDDISKSDDDLIAEAERIIAGCQTPTD